MKHHIKTALGGMIALSLAHLVGCGSDEDIRINPDPQTQTPPAGGSGNEGDLNPDQLHSGGECSACPTPTMGVSCCTTAEDVTAIRAVAAGECGTDMTEFGFPGCTQLDQPGVLDEACPPVEFPPGAPPMPGCCTEAGHCGAMETYVGMGCTSNPDTSTWVACGG